MNNNFRWREESDYDHPLAVANYTTTHKEPKHRQARERGAGVVLVSPPQCFVHFLDAEPIKQPLNAPHTSFGQETQREAVGSVRAIAMCIIISSDN